MYAFTQDGGKTQFMPHFNNGIDPDLGLLNPVMYNVDFRPPYAPQTDSRGTQCSFPKAVYVYISHSDHGADAHAIL
jgi:hypothetical protein